MISIHVVRVGVFNVDDAGSILRKNDHSVTIKQQMTTSMDHRVIPDAAVASSTGYPSVKAYLEAEAAIDFVLHHMDQSTIVTYKRTSGGGFA